MQCQGQLWAAADGSAALVLETVKTIRLRRLLTEFSDGSLLASAAARTTTPYEHGPGSDSLSVYPDGPVGEMVGCVAPGQGGACAPCRPARKALAAQPSSLKRRRRIAA